MGTLLLVILTTELVVLGLLYFLFKRYYTKVPPLKNKYFWLSVIIVPPVILVSGVYLWFLSQANFDAQPFNQALWEQDSDKRYLYADDLIDNNKLIGKSTQYIESILGEPMQKDSIIMHFYIGYSPKNFINIDPDYLVVELKNDRASQVYLID